MLRTAAKSNRKAGGKYTYARLAHDTGSARARFAHNPRRRGGPEREKASRNPPATMCGKTAAPSFKIQKKRGNFGGSGQPPMVYIMFPQKGSRSFSKKAENP